MCANCFSPLNYANPFNADTPDLDAAAAQQAAANSAMFFGPSTQQLSSGPAADELAGPGYADPTGIPQLDAQGFLLDPSNPASGLVGTTLTGLPVWSATRNAQHNIRNGGNWADLRAGASEIVLTYSFGDPAVLIPGSGYEPYSTQASQDAARGAMQMYADVANVSFVQSANPSVADVTFRWREGSTGGSGGAGGPSNSGATITMNHSSQDISTPGSYQLFIQAHELGHVMGMTHPGDYNGASATYAMVDHFGDTGQYTVESYFFPPSTGGSSTYLATLGLHDILTMQMYYGANMQTRAGDTVYGFNTNAGQTYDLSKISNLAMSIWDGAGNDTIDFSGYTASTVVDLRPGSFSSGGNARYNVSIAYGAQIENGIGGFSDDRMRGNDIGNVLTGGHGDDTMYGGAETAPVIVVNPRDFVGYGLNREPLINNQYLEVAQLNNTPTTALTLEMMVEFDRLATGATLASLSPNSGLEFRIVSNILQVTIKGVSYSTGYNAEHIIDGDPHRLSLSWNSADGGLKIYIDGALAHSGAVAQGLSLLDNGRLVIGQGQNSAGTSINATREFDGVIGDIRLFNTVRTAQEISDNAFTTLTGAEAGLVHYWKIDPATGVAIADVVPGGAQMSAINAGSVANTAPVINMSPDNDTLLGGEGQDQVFGGFGDDQINGGSGADQLFGGIGDDVIQGDDTDAGHGAVHGLSLNTGGASGQSLRRNSLGGLPQTALTLAMDFKFDTIPASQWFYSQPGLSLLIDPSTGGLWVNFGSGWSKANVSMAQLGDGKSHQYVFTWDGATGDVAHYLDGARTNSATNIFTGGTLSASGIGNVALNPVGGTFGDLRVYTRALTAAEVLAGVGRPLEDPANTDGLVVNWVVGADGSVTDLAGGLNPTLTGTPPSAVLFAATSFDDTIDGGAGADTADYGLAASSVTVDLTQTSAQNTGGAGIDTLISIENVFASNFDDEITGDGGENMLRGNGGDDSLSGGGNGDLIYGGLGTNVLDGGAGADTACYGDATAGVTVDLTFTGAQDTGFNTDTLVDIENVAGSRYNDVIFGSATDNILRGMRGDDRLTGGGGRDTLAGGADANVLDGGDGSDWASYCAATTGVTVDLALTGPQITGFSIDTLIGIEKLFGSKFNDVLSGGAKYNVLNGYGGADKLYGGAGSDVLIGGFGADRFVFKNVDGSIDTIADFASNDFVQISAAGFGGGLNAGDGETLVTTSDYQLATETGAYVIFQDAGADAGTLYFDATGGAGADAVAFAKLTGTQALEAADISIVA